MYQQAQLKPGLSRLHRLGRVRNVRLGAALALSLAIAFIAWLATSDGGSSRANPATDSQSALAAIQKTAGTGPVAQSVADLKAFAAAAGHPIYWAGPKADLTYELTKTTNGRVYVRYLPPGVKVGVNEPYLTIATYPYPNAFAAVQTLAKNSGGGIKLDRGGIALVDRAYPKSIHLAFPGQNYEVEVFSPTPALTRQIVESGEISAIR
jgi:type IV secretory pathway VirB2 component (pilin)